MREQKSPRDLETDTVKTCGRYVVKKEVGMKNWKPETNY
jgi:hypothetical protein